MGIVSKAVKFLISPIGAIIGGKVGKLITAATLIVAGVISGQPQLVMAGLAYGASALQKKSCRRDNPLAYVTALRCNFTDGMSGPASPCSLHIRKP